MSWCLPEDFRPQGTDAPLRFLGIIDRALLRLDENLELLDSHPLFDRNFYLQSHVDLAQQRKDDPLAHYLCHGGIEGRDPHPLFDSSFYAEKYPETLAGAINPLVHYLEIGAWEQLDPHPIFDTGHYLQQNRDLCQFSFNPLQHYLTRGLEEGRVGRRVSSLDDAANAISTSKFQSPLTRIRALSGGAISHVIVTGFISWYHSRRKS